MRSETALVRDPRASDAVLISFIALCAHLAVAYWAKDRFPPAADGTFYHVIATRIAEGFGYTWLWPDGSVTFAAHYPVGYPGLLGLAYAVVTPSPFVAMLLNAVFATAGTFAVHRLASRVASRRGALFGAALAALHPGLLLYTPALMTEALGGASLAVLGWLVDRLRFRHPTRALVVAGVGLGAVCLVRPQLVLLAPVFALWLVRWDGGKPRVQASLRVLGHTAGVAALALLVSAPWTARNCARLGHCAWISTNAGWNLFIGTAKEGRGTWLPLDEIGVPETCRGVFGEAEKDHCFKDAAVGRILADPVSWIALIPEKLGVTFNGGSPAASYLHSSNSTSFGTRERDALGVVDTLFQRITIGAALVAVMRTPGPRRRLRMGLTACGILALLSPLGWLAVVALVLGGIALGASLLENPALYYCVSILALTLATHAAFFGAQRYAMVAAYALAAAAGSAFVRKAPT